MIGDLFDSPWKILIIAIVILVLFGSRKLPAAARSLGQSMRILKTEIKDLHEEDDARAAQEEQAVRPPQQLVAPVPVVSTPMAAPPVSTPVASVPVPPEQHVAAPVTTPVASVPVPDVPRDSSAS